MPSTKTNCTKCGAEIQASTSDYFAGMCAICGGTARAIAWRRSRAFIWVCFVLPSILIAFVVWRLFQQQWVWAWALLFLIPHLILNIKLRTSTEPPPC